MTEACATTISTCLDSLRGCADQARRCAEPYITTRVTVQTWRWTEGELGAGNKVLLRETRLPKRFPVRQPGGREIASSGGRLTEYDVIVDGISPPYTSHGGGGFSVDQLDPKRLPTPNHDIEILYCLEGDIAGEFTLVSLNSSDNVEWSMVLRNTRLTP